VRYPTRVSGCVETFGAVSQSTPNENAIWCHRSQPGTLGRLELPAQAGDLVVLCGEARQRVGAERFEIGDRLVGSAEPFPQPDHLGLEALELGEAVVGLFAVVTKSAEALFEFGFEVGVGTVESGSCHPGQDAQALQVALGALGDLAGEELVHGGPDPLLGLVMTISRHR